MNNKKYYDLEYLQMKYFYPRVLTVWYQHTGMDFYKS